MARLLFATPPTICHMLSAPRTRVTFKCYKNGGRLKWIPSLVARPIMKTPIPTESQAHPPLQTHPCLQSRGLVNPITKVRWFLSRIPRNEINALREEKQKKLRDRNLLFKMVWFDMNVKALQVDIKQFGSNWRHICMYTSESKCYLVSFFIDVFPPHPHKVRGELIR